MQQCKGNNFNPLNWGWKKPKNGLIPIAINKLPAAQTLIETIVCGCIKGCQGNCRHLEINCVMFFNEWIDLNCKNAEIPYFTEDYGPQQTSEKIDINI